MSIKISVGSLTEFCQTGDINFRFSGRSSATEGVAGHQQVQRARLKQIEHYEKEVVVDGIFHSGDHTIEVSGRVDGVFQQDGQLVVDEIKTLRVDVGEIPDGVLASYWLQAALYGHLLTVNRSDTDPRADSELLLRLCLYHLDEKTETVLERRVSVAELEVTFLKTLGAFITWLEQRQAWRALRDSTLESLEFPYTSFRPGQRDMAVSVFRAIKQNERLVMQAPTGIGKTMGTLYPAVKALVNSDLERIFYVSARTSTQSLAANAAEDITHSGGRLRTVTLTAKDKVCLSPGQPCHPDHCPYAVGYYDKVGGVIEGLLDQGDSFDRTTIEAAAREHTVCPFELSLDLSRHCDLIVADYNYVFDPVVYLRRFFDTDRRDSVVLVDESHNLVDRARDMFSASLSKQPYLGLAGSGSALAKAARRVNQNILDLRKPIREAYKTEGVATFSEPPNNLLKALQGFCEQAELILREDRTDDEGELLQAYFDALRFARTAEDYDDNYVTLLRGQGRDMEVKLCCVAPAARLEAVYDRLASLVCFSATLTPRNYFSNLLGFTDSVPWYRLPSPFAPEHCRVVVATHVDTSYKGRSASLSDLIDLIFGILDSRRGNYLVYFPSYAYMEQVYAEFSLRFPDVSIRMQARHMSEDERDEFVSEFERQPHCGFAVTGGIFSEGIDLKGDRLIGAIVVGVGLPQLDVERDLIKAQFPDNGFEYAYQYPGFTRVLQAAGRVIRDDEDRGVICLIDRRYGERRYQSLFPAEWQFSLESTSSGVLAQLADFWTRSSPDTEHTAGKDPAD